MITRMGKFLVWAVISALIILSFGCSSDDGGTVGGAGDSDITECPPNRPPPPVACTLEYDPVCGFKTDGSSQTYANSCNACADLKVVSYLMGNCH